MSTRNVECTPRHSPDKLTAEADLKTGFRFMDALCRWPAEHPPA